MDQLHLFARETTIPQGLIHRASHGALWVVGFSLILPSRVNGDLCLNNFYSIDEILTCDFDRQNIGRPSVSGRRDKTFRHFAFHEQGFEDHGNEELSWVIFLHYGPEADRTVYILPNERLPIRRHLTSSKFHIHLPSTHSSIS